MSHHDAARLRSVLKGAERARDRISRLLEIADGYEPQKRIRAMHKELRQQKLIIQSLKEQLQCSEESDNA